jgi:cytochrome c553
MKNSILGAIAVSALSVTLIGCTNNSAPAPKAQASAGNAAAGKVIAERDCKACHGLDGKGVAPGIPNLAAQREAYLFDSLMEYKNGNRPHAAMTSWNMSEADLHNLAAYYASLPAVSNPTEADIKHSSPYEQGKALAAASCSRCHGEDGNSTIPGTPTLAGQQPRYLVAAFQEYHQGERKKNAMGANQGELNNLDLEDLALYFSSQTPVKRAAPTIGDPAKGEAESAMCGGCHGMHGVSVDSATPNLAGQDAEYLVKAIKAYRTTRKNWGMQRYVAGLTDEDINNIAAYFATQQPKAANKVPTSTEELADKCNRCHDQPASPTMAAPKLRGQNKDYLVMSLRAYRDGKRASSFMHAMIYPYSDAIIDSIATWYASQPAK